MRAFFEVVRYVRGIPADVVSSTLLWRSLNVWYAYVGRLERTTPRLDQESNQSPSPSQKDPISWDWGEVRHLSVLHFREGRWIARDRPFLVESRWLITMTEEQSRHHATRLSLGARLLDRLAMLDPRCWWGCFQIMNAYLAPTGPLMVETLARAFIPALILVTVRCSPTVAWVALASPWSVGSVSRIVPELSKRMAILNSWRTMRSPPLPDAIACLEDRMDMKRAYRTRRYDIYLPPEPVESNEERSGQALLLLPGALIDHESYSEIAGRLSDAGILVVVVSLEPFRMASKYLGQTSTKVLVRLTKQISKLYPHFQKWSVAGHSFGGYRVAELIATNDDISPRLPFQNFILWASPAVHQLLALPTANEKRRIRLLSIQGERDPTRFMMGGDDNLGKILEAFPHAREVILKGACHSQFGSYHPTNHTNDPNHWTHHDVATISREDQLDQVGNTTLNFMKSDV